MTLRRNSISDEVTFVGSALLDVKHTKPESRSCHRFVLFRHAYGRVRRAEMKDAAAKLEGITEENGADAKVVEFSK